MAFLRSGCRAPFFVLLLGLVTHGVAQVQTERNSPQLLGVSQESIDVKTPAAAAPPAPSVPVERFVVTDVKRITGVESGGFNPVADTAHSDVNNSLKTTWMDPDAPPWKLWAPDKSRQLGLCLALSILTAEYYHAFFASEKDPALVQKLYFPGGVPTKTPHLRGYTEAGAERRRYFARLVAAGHLAPRMMHSPESLHGRRPLPKVPIAIGPPFTNEEATSEFQLMRTQILQFGSSIIGWSSQQRNRAHALLTYEVHDGEVAVVGHPEKRHKVKLLSLWDPNFPSPLPATFSEDRKKSIQELFTQNGLFLIYFPERAALSFPAPYIAKYGQEPGTTQNPIQGGTFLGSADFYIIGDDRVRDAVAGAEHHELFRTDLDGTRPPWWASAAEAPIVGVGTGAFTAAAVVGADFFRQVEERRRNQREFERRGLKGPNSRLRPPGG